MTKLKRTTIMDIDKTIEFLEGLGEIFINDSHKEKEIVTRGAERLISSLKNAKTYILYDEMVR